MKSGRKKGTTKTGGRKKGTPNKRTIDVIERLNETIDVIERLNELDCDPIAGMAEIAKLAMSEQNLTLAGYMYKELAQYMAPKRKAMEFTVETVREIEAEDLTDQQKSNLIKLLS